MFLRLGKTRKKKLVEVPNIERMEKIFDYCIICGRKNNSHYHNLCNSCNNRIEHVEDIINLKNHFEGKFTKRNIVDLGYSKPYSDALVRELLDEKLILKNDKAYCFNDECFDEYLNEWEQIQANQYYGNWKPNSILNNPQKRKENGMV
jgi:hypothetical protein